MRKKNKKVLVALSGGVDSAVAAALLLQKGYEVVGAFMIQYENSSNVRSQSLERESCWHNDYREALRVAAHLRITLFQFDFTKDYKKHVLDYLYREYRANRTPNPDVLCNTFIKFGVWLEKAKDLDFDYLATGHYARNMRTSKMYESKKSENYFSTSNFQNASQFVCYHLMMAKDKIKDQTYFLHQLNQEQLSRVLFPIGDYTKPQVRRLAKRFGLPNATREESMGICFVGEVPMKDFLKNQIKTKVGDIVLSSGEIIGKHEGLELYTIGQRHIGVQGSRPLYVVDKYLKTNELVVGFEADPLLYKKEITIDDVRWVSGQEPKFPLTSEVRLRHRQALQKCRIMNNESGIMVEFGKPQRAVTPGQFAVLYKNGECLGGGVIQ